VADFKHVRENNMQGNPFVDNRFEGMDIQGMADGTGFLPSVLTIWLMQQVLTMVQRQPGHALHTVYSQLKDENALVERLLTRRPLSFYGAGDGFRLRRDKELAGGSGVDNYTSLIAFEDYLHPDEAVMAGYLGMVLPSATINRGDRHNAGKPVGSPGTAVVVAQVGARLEKEDTGDYRILTNQPKTAIEKLIHTFLTQLAKVFHLAVPTTVGYSAVLYRMRSYVVMNALITGVVGAIAKRSSDEPKIVLQVTGIGLGEFAGTFETESTRAFGQGLCDALRFSNGSVRIAELQLLHLDLDAPTLEPLQQICDSRGIILRNNLRKPPFDPSNAGKLVVTSFAWDGMSFLGNEFFDGQRAGASADPSMAAATTIAFLGHPEVNPEAYRREYSGCTPTP
jgi:hypothetical protein